MDYSQPWFVDKYSNYPISRAIVKYGFDNFIIIVLAYTNQDNLINLEQEFIDKYSPEYNTLKQANSSKGHKHSELSKRKMRLAKLGHVMSNETRDKISKSRTGINKGYSMSEQAKNKLSISMQGNNNNIAKQIQVIDVNTGLINVYKGYAEARFYTGVSHQTVRKHIGKQYKNYIFNILPIK